jgi:hypothetical protein
MALPRGAEDRVCRSCRRPLGDGLEAGWECECGITVCGERECFEEWFKVVAAGEGTRCLSCGLVT